MTESEAKQKRKLKEAINDVVRIIPERYTWGDMYKDFGSLETTSDLNKKRKLTTQIIAGLLRWQLDNL